MNSNGVTHINSARIGHIQISVVAHFKQIYIKFNGKPVNPKMTTVIRHIKLFIADEQIIATPYQLCNKCAPRCCHHHRELCVRSNSSLQYIEFCKPNLVQWPDHYTHAHTRTHTYTCKQNKEEEKEKKYQTSFCK